MATTPTTPGKRARMPGDLERALGNQLRDLRIERRLTQSELAEHANVSLGAVKNLERGAGSTVTTLAKVLRALGEEHWFDTLVPDQHAFNPLDLLEVRRTQRQRRPTRVRHHRTEP